MERGYAFHMKGFYRDMKCREQGKRNWKTVRTSYDALLMWFSSIYHFTADQGDHVLRNGDVF